MEFVIVIDALDECDREEDIREILRLLAQAKDIKQISLRILLLRKDVPIKSDYDMYARSDDSNMDARSDDSNMDARSDDSDMDARSDDSDMDARSDDSDDGSWTRARGLEPNLLQVCRQLHKEGTAILHGENVFGIRITVDKDGEERAYFLRHNHFKDAANRLRE